MSSRSKKEYLEAIYLRYKSASQKNKTIILDEFSAACGYHRKHAIRLLKKLTRFYQNKKKEERKNTSIQQSSYCSASESDLVVRKSSLLKETESSVAVMVARICSGVRESSRRSHRRITHHITTIDRLLKSVRVTYKGRGRSTTKPETLPRKQIPIKTAP